MHNETGLLANAKWELSQCEYLEGELGTDMRIRRNQRGEWAF